MKVSLHLISTRDIHLEGFQKLPKTHLQVPCVRRGSSKSVSTELLLLLWLHPHPRNMRWGGGGAGSPGQRTQLLDVIGCWPGRRSKEATGQVWSQLTEVKNNPQPRASKEMGTSILQLPGTEFCPPERAFIKETALLYLQLSPWNPGPRSTRLCPAVPGFSPWNCEINLC